MIDAFSRRILDIHGATGQEWLDRLPALLRECEQRWSITIEAPFAALSYNYVAPAQAIDGSLLVVKLGVPNPELLAEIEALRLFDGDGTVRLIEADPNQGVLLLERARPGTPLMALPDDAESTSIAAKVMRQLWRPAPAHDVFPTLTRWFRSLRQLRKIYDGKTGPLPSLLVEAAERSSTELIASTDSPMLLHGDLHHENVVAAEREPWLALDPKGVIGDAASEVGPWLHNVAPHILAASPLKETMDRRVRQFAEELGFDRERIRSWGLSYAVLSACWSLEDHGEGWEWPILCAETLAHL